MSQLRVDDMIKCILIIQLDNHQNIVCLILSVGRCVIMIKLQLAAGEREGERPQPEWRDERTGGTEQSRNCLFLCEKKANRGHG